MLLHEVGEESTPQCASIPDMHIRTILIIPESSRLHEVISNVGNTFEGNALGGAGERSARGRHAGLGGLECLDRLVY